MNRPRSTVLAVLLVGLVVSGAAPTRPAATPAAGASPSVLPFIHDDYDRAVAEARARKVPLFIEAWAPW